MKVVELAAQIGCSDVQEVYPLLKQVGVRGNPEEVSDTIAKKLIEIKSKVALALPSGDVEPSQPLTKRSGAIDKDNLRSLAESLDCTQVLVRSLIIQEQNLRLVVAYQQGYNQELSKLDQQKAFEQGRQLAQIQELEAQQRKHQAELERIASLQQTKSFIDTEAIERKLQEFQLQEQERELKQRQAVDLLKAGKSPAEVAEMVGFEPSPFLMAISRYG